MTCSATTWTVLVLFGVSFSRKSMQMQLFIFQINPFHVWIISVYDIFFSNFFFSFCYCHNVNLESRAEWCEFLIHPFQHHDLFSFCCITFPVFQYFILGTSFYYSAMMFHVFTQKELEVWWITVIHPKCVAKAQQRFQYFIKPYHDLAPHHLLAHC